MNTMKLSDQDVELQGKIFQSALQYVDHKLPNDQRLGKQIRKFRDRFNKFTHQERSRFDLREKSTDELPDVESTPIEAIGTDDPYYKEVAVGEVYVGE